MRAEILSIGSDITSGQNLDTNSQWLSLRLAELGVPVAFHTTVADDFADNVDGKEHRPRFELRDGRPVPINMPLPGRLKNPFEEWVDEHSHVASFLGYQASLLKARWRNRGSALASAKKLWISPPKSCSSWSRWPVAPSRWCRAPAS